MGEAVLDGELYSISDVLSVERGTRAEGDPRGLRAVIESEAGHGHGVCYQSSIIQRRDESAVSHYPDQCLRLLQTSGHGPDESE